MGWPGSPDPRLAEPRVDLPPNPPQPAPEAGSSTSAPTVTRSAAGRRTGPRLRRPGLIGAAIGVAASLQPSLLPREPPAQGVLSGLLLVCGYGLGIGMGRLLVPDHGWPRALAPRLLADAATVVLVLVAAGPYLSRQNQLRTAMGMPQATAAHWPAVISATALTACACWVLVLLASGLRRRVAHRFGPFPGMAAAVVLLAGAILLPLGAVFAITTAFGQSRDAGTTPGTSPPDSPLRSGSPSSSVDWDTLGRKGRDFVSHGPTVAELAAYSGAPARQAIRVYIGTRSADSLSARAQLAVAELARTGAWQRSVLVVAMPTGTGQVEPFAADALEYLHLGDTAIVAAQYSSRPSWLSVLLDRPVARETARALFDAIYEVWRELPPAQRPALYLYGHSLGAEAFIPVIEGLAARGVALDGALLAGPPVAWHGSEHPVWVRALRHTSDPVSLFTPSLALIRPDWLSDARPTDLDRAMQWLPGVTLLQVAADLPQAVFVPWGFGHMYSEVEYGSAWAALTLQADLAPADQVRLLDQMRHDSSPVVGLLD